LSANKKPRFPIDNIRGILFFKLKNSCPFFQSFPQLFHNAIHRKPLLDKASGLDWKCQHFFLQRRPA